MKKLRWIIIAGLALSAVCVQAAEPTPPGPVVRRATLLVADVAKSIDFYQRLGFSVWYDQGGDRDPARPMTLPLNVKPGYSRLVIMKGRDPWIGMIGLLGYDKPKPAANRTNADKIGLGDVIIMVETDDVPGSYSRLSEIKATILQPPQSFETKGADGKTMVGMNLFAVDPDGHVIELSQPAR